MFDPKKITELREKKRFTVDGLMIGLNNFGMRVSSNTIRNWESGETVPSANHLGKLAQFFKKPIKYFYK